MLDLIFKVLAAVGAVLGLYNLAALLWRDRIKLKVLPEVHTNTFPPIGPFRDVEELIGLSEPPSACSSVGISTDHTSVPSSVSRHTRCRSAPIKNKRPCETAGVLDCLQRVGALSRCCFQIRFPEIASRHTISSTC